MSNALEWWLTLSFEEKFYKAIEWCKLNGYDTTDYHSDRLKDEDIISIYLTVGRDV
jgi:hypothetical protein